MKLAFYIAAKGNWIDKLIAANDGGRFSHVELVFDHSDGGPFDPANALCFTSSHRDGGTRFKRIDLTDSKWELLDLPTWLAMESRAYQWCRGQLGKKYDLLGVLAFKFPVRQDGGRWFCSEVCATCLQVNGLATWPSVDAHTRSPDGLYDLARAWSPR